MAKPTTPATHAPSNGPVPAPPHAISVGAADRGRITAVVDLGLLDPEDPTPARAEALRHYLNAHRAADKKSAGWWCAATFRTRRRRTADWVASCAVVVDVDTVDHAPADPGLTADARAHMAFTAVTPSVVHVTHSGGVRAAFLLDEPATDAEAWTTAARGAAELVRHLLASAGLAEAFVVDVAATCDRARLWFLPPPNPDPDRYDIDTPAGWDGAVTLAALAAHAPADDTPASEPAPAPPHTTTRATSGSDEFAAAVAAWDAAHPLALPATGRAACPVCESPDGWGALPDSPGRWVCHSTRHTVGGIQGRGCWTGDALDIEAHRRGVSRAEVLRVDGFLSAPTRQPPTVAPGTATVPAEPDDDKSGKRESQASRLVRLATEAGADLWHDAAHDAYLTVPVGGHSETYAVRSRDARRWLARAYYSATNEAPGATAMDAALGVLEARALFDGVEREAHVRVARQDGAIYLDLGDPGWRVVAITAEGWAVREAADAPVRFRRPAGLRPLPDPVRPRTRREALRALGALLRLARVGSRRNRRLALAWLLAVLLPGVPSPVLALVGEQGAGKSFAAELLRAVIDPNAVPLRLPPKNADDLVIAARGGRVVAIDNLSHVEPWLSDSLCRLATGGGLGKRTLFTDLDETLSYVQRPVILTSIDCVVTRGDLADRCVALTVPTLDDDDRRGEDALRAEFAAAHPLILGALLDAAVIGLGRLEAVELNRPPRLADWARWCAACAPALGLDEDELVELLRDARRAGQAEALEASPVGSAMLAWASDLPGPWQGTAEGMLDLVARRASEEVRRSRAWPQTARGLSAALRRLVPALRVAGVSVTAPGPNDRPREWRVVPPPAPEVTP